MHTYVRVCVIMCAWMCGCVKLDTILYNTAHICHGGELTHELNRDKEQIYLKQLCYILWTTVKFFFLLNPKNELRIYIYKLYICICIMQQLRKTTMDTTFYLILSGFRNDSCFPFLTPCPMYLFVPCTPQQYPNGFQAIWQSGHGTIRKKINSKRIHLLN